MTNYNSQLIAKSDELTNMERSDGLVMRMIEGEMSAFEFERAVESLLQDQAQNEMRHDARIQAASDLESLIAAFDCCEDDDEEWLTTDEDLSDQWYND